MMTVLIDLDVLVMVLQVWGKWGQRSRSRADQIWS